MDVGISGASQCFGWWETCGSCRRVEPGDGADGQGGEYAASDGDGWYDDLPVLRRCVDGGDGSTETDANDARGIRLSLTTSGRKLYRKLIGAAAERNDDAGGDLGKISNGRSGK